MTQRSSWKSINTCTQVGLAMAALLSAPVAWAQSADPKEWQLNMGRGVTQTARMAYEAHMVALWVCVAIGALVFSAMGYAMFKFRKSKGAVAAQFSHNTTAEVLWTVIPVLVLIAMAWPATAKLIAMYDTRESEMTVKVTGYQWMWKYEYLGQGVEFTSRLARESDRIRQSGERPTAASQPHYLLDVDNRLVLPVNTKIRFVITADDVIHAWWVPALGWKQDAIPGIVNEAWTNIEQPGVYRGQCAELCGKDHGFMPIVVEALPKADFQRWLASRRRASGTAPGAAPAAPAAAPTPASAPAAPAAPAGDAAPAAVPAQAAAPTAAL
ncbi:cytochrome c oxidase subunit II [Xanthomonas citri pv. citri]|uniref:Cytochrome c oxidase subunit 2 n=5 Tax=Xanthomonas citri TaxID=346 RepID=A0A0U5FR08_XANCI|nr:MULTISPECIES: cytochrome c oxidase subunit II [Xanthomonas]AOY61439.1 cytochrome c oxidase subunit II [Xanthomonas citri pv. glycines str. 8ra]APR15259.1 cytochrome c oxidase subunit II [Xanthomonas citri pv. citri]ARR13882.1 cytochrome c oxidase subunit II [Xanthomonas citri pv. citri]ARR15984.1 cytochrome c oxidase subunit II [Xanthomonas citri pv. citri]ARR21782.1 cytochrome c oxidase subunit II [Xanthomonas citri pv. citri]